MYNQPHYVEIYGVQNTLSGIGKADAVAEISMHPYISGGKSQFEMKVTVGEVCGEPDGLSVDDVRGLICSAVKNFATRCFSEISAPVVGGKLPIRSSNLYGDTANKVMPGYYYKAVLVGFETGERKEFFAVNKRFFDDIAGKDNFEHAVRAYGGRVEV